MLVPAYLAESRDEAAPRLRVVDGDGADEGVREPDDAGPLLLVVTDPDAPWVREALAAGAELVAWVTPTARPRYVRPVLAPREVEVLRLVADGLLDKQIARELGIELSTVKEYVKRIRSRYGRVGRPAPSRVHLCRRAMEDGLV